jgi:hypothetical protein
MSQNFDEARLARIMNALPDEIQPAELYALVETICDRYGVPVLGRIILALDILKQHAHKSVQISKEEMH